MLKSMNDHSPKESLHHIYLCKSLYWKKMFMMHRLSLLAYSRDLKTAAAT